MNTAILRDLRDTLRQLRQAPVFTTTAVCTLALGIGATTAIFTLVQQVMLRSLPVARPAELWRIGDSIRCCHADGYQQNDWNFFSWEAYQLFRANTQAFADLAAFQVGNAALGVRPPGSSAAPETDNGEFVSGNFFRTFGIAAWRGRVFTDADDREGAQPVAVMSFHTWQSQYGSDPSLIGATFQLNGHPFTLLGVTPPGFYGVKLDGGTMPDFWLPLTTNPLLDGPSARLKNNGEAWLNLIGRIRPGVNPGSLEAQLQLELHQWLASHLADMSAQEKSQWEKQTLHLTPGGAGISLLRQNYQSGLQLLLLVALCVLLLACANLANLLLARGLRDRPQTALRAALGASRTRLVQKALIESLTLAVLGAAAGIAVAYAGATLILHLAFTGPNSWIPVNASPSPPVLLFALAISLTTALLFGIAPAWIASHTHPMEALHGVNRATRAHHGALARKGLVIVQAALSLVLLSAAAMLGQSLRNLEQRNFGFDLRGRYLVSINSKLSSYQPDQLPALFRALEDRLRAIPGVRAVSPALYAPMSGSYWDHPIRIAGQPEPSPQDEATSAWTRVTPGFFETLGDRILLGRSIAASDTAASQPVAVVNEAFARKFFGRRNPIGQHFGPAPRSNAATYRIIGVVADLHYFASTGNDPVSPLYFLPQAQATHFAEPSLETREVWSHYPYSIVIWAPGNPPDLAVQVKRALAGSQLVLYGVRPYQEIIRGDLAQQNMLAGLTSLFGILGLLLAAVGLYGVTAYGVEQRTGEIGVRMALGAHRRSVVAMVLRGAFAQIAVGLALGIPAAIGAGHLIASRLFGVTPWDPLPLAYAAALLALAALIAALIPALRAATADPAQALRAE